MYKEKILNVATGEETWRNYTDAEVAEVKVAQSAAAELELLQADADAKKNAAKAKLAALGLDDDDLKALGL